jgi:hypothetical protein
LSGAKIVSVFNIRNFIFAGNSRFSIKSVKTGVHYTFRVKLSDDGNVFFVSVLTGPDNIDNYRSFGTIRNGRFAMNKKPKIGEDAPSVTAFRFFWEKIAAHRIHPMIEFWHEGRCGRCSRPLTDPTSIESGFGPECITKVNV